MFGPKTLKSTLAKVTNFIKEIEEGIIENDVKNEVLDERAKVIADEKAVNAAETEIGRKLLAKLQ